jgi:hypothetical protein
VFSQAEDEMLISLVGGREKVNWGEIAKDMPGRSARQCRDRWSNYLSPKISLEPWTAEEDIQLVERINEIGTKWTTIARLTPGRSDNSVKNRWYSWLHERCQQDESGKFVLTVQKRSEKKPRRSRRRPPQTVVRPREPEPEPEEEQQRPKEEESDTSRDFWEWVMEGVPELAGKMDPKSPTDSCFHWF